MRAIKIDANRNPVISNGRFVFVFYADVVAQNCEQAMRQQRGELNYDADKGIQYFDNIFTGNPNFQRFESQARRAILNVPGVTGINTFNFEFNGNILSYNADYSSVFGPITVANQI